MSGRRLLRRPLSIEEILRWASAHREATGRWPMGTSGAIIGARFETWTGVDRALRVGLRGLPGKSSLAQLLAEKHGVRNTRNRPSLSLDQILQWADEHHDRTGAWPIAITGRIPNLGGETWGAISSALRHGRRGLPGASSLAKLLARRRTLRNRRELSPLTLEQILEWADRFHEHTGDWPMATSGLVPDVPGETWLAADSALRLGDRGLPGGSSLARLLADKREARNSRSLPKLPLEQVLTWGQPGGSSLFRLLAKKRGLRDRLNLPPLTPEQILAWADRHFARTGSWPKYTSGAIIDAPGESWAGMGNALRNGRRGLAGGSSLAKLLANARTG
jgi:hypothetical protein